MITSAEVFIFLAVFLIPAFLANMLARKGKMTFWPAFLLYPFIVMAVAAAFIGWMKFMPASFRATEPMLGFIALIAGLFAVVCTPFALICFGVDQRKAAKKKAGE